MTKAPTPAEKTKILPRLQEASEIKFSSNVKFFGRKLSSPLILCKKRRGFAEMYRQIFHFQIILYFGRILFLCSEG